MNFLSRLISSGSSSSGQKGIVTIAPGEFSIIRREDSPKGRRELIFKEAEISLISTSREFFPQIKVADLDDQDENAEESQAIEPDELDLGSEDDNTFLVHKDIHIGYYLSSTRVAIAWSDPEGDEGDHFEFLCADSVSKEALDKFDHSVGLALYGQRYGKAPPPGAPESIFDEFTYNYEEAANKPAGVKNADGDDSDADGHGGDTKREFSEGRIIVSAECDLCIFDSVQGVFISPKSMQGVTAVLLDQNDYQFFLEIRDSENAIMGTPVTEEMNQYVDGSNKALIFNYENENKLVISYLLRFRDLKVLYDFDEKIGVAQFEHTTRTRWNELPQDQQDYLSEAMSGVELKGEDAEQQSTGDEEDDLEDIDVQDNDDDEDEDGGKHERNSALEVGHVNDRTYVVRGSKIGVFKNTDRELKYSTTIENLDIDPNRIMLHEQDRALVIQGKDDLNTLYRMDLETGKIVEEWNTGREVNDFNPISKFAQTTQETNIFGVANQSMFRIDPRIDGGLVPSSAEKVYKKRVGLSHVVTTADGNIIVGDAKGQIRLYNTLGKDAVSLIPGLGNPLVGLDVSSDGNYVLGTCEKYLILISIGELKNQTQYIRKKSLGRPIKLYIMPENVSFMYQQSGQPIKFTPARFNTGLNKKEATIVTSTGPYLVIWNFEKARKGIVQSYKIKKYKSEITSENFKFGTDQRVILTLEDDVDMVAKSSLKSPDAIFKPYKPRQSRK